MAKIDSNGVLQWQRACGGGWADGSRDIAITPDGGCIFIASTVSSDGDVVGYHETPDSLKVRPDDRYTDIWIVKLSNKGKLEWQKCLGGALNDDPTAVVCDKYGNYIISGASFSKDGELPIDNLGRKTYLFKLDKQGNFIWKKHIGGTIGNGFNELLIDEDNCIVGAGATNSNDFDAITNHGDAYTIDAWVVKFCTELPPINIVANSNTLNIYPNPASSAVYIATQNVKEIRLIDALGRVYINKKIDNTNNAGFTYLSLNYIANGTYMVQAMDSNGQVKIGKLVVTK
jgi:hypothetical protein